MSEEISNKVKKIVADHLGVDESKITNESSFIDDLGADSLDTVELVMAFEEEFGSEISDSEAEKILTVGDAIKFIETKSASNSDSSKVKVALRGQNSSATCASLSSSFSQIILKVGDWTLPADLALETWRHNKGETLKPIK